MVYDAFKAVSVKAWEEAISKVVGELTGERWECDISKMDYADQWPLSNVAISLKLSLPLPELVEIDPKDAVI